MTCSFSFIHPTDKFRPSQYLVHKIARHRKILSGCQAICFHKTLIEIIKKIYFKNDSCQHGASARGLVSSEGDKKPSKMHITNIKSECDINSVLLSNFWSVYEIWCIVCLVHIHFHIRTEQIIANDAKKKPRRYESNVFKTMLRLSANEDMEKRQAMNGRHTQWKCSDINLIKWQWHCQRDDIIIITRGKKRSSMKKAHKQIHTIKKNPRQSRASQASQINRHR